MTWHVGFIDNYQQTGECCLKLRHGKRGTQLRGWFGPLARHLYSLTQPQFHANQSKTSKHLAIDKQMAQFLLIQASFFHQRCFHMYQVKDDIKRQNLNFSHEVCELLLFIRMSNHHPSHKTIQLFVQHQIPWCEDFEKKIEDLLAVKLIQKFSHNNLVFYDKNPYPHDHLLDLKTLKLEDFIDREYSPNQQQLLICQIP